ncbi:hypothetical protein, partial [Acrocarpospora catenulata]|uniref:hypothetical protein n=1 Tax=Acrocarpospora catenulata TaxID=2836182 RepID=UPI001BD92781
PTPTPSPTPTAPIVTTKLPGVDAEIFEAATDPIALTYYDVTDKSKDTWVNYPRDGRNGEFTRSTKYWMQYISPDGTIAAGRNRNYTTDNYHALDVITRATGARKSIKIAKQPLTYDYAEWSRSGNLLLLSLVNPSGEVWTTKGFVVVDIAAGRATTRQINDPAIKNGRFYWSPDQAALVVSYEDGDSKGLRYYNFQGEVVRTIPDVGEPANTSGGLFSPSGDRFVTACAGQTSGTCVWNTADGTASTRFSSDCTNVLGWWDDQHLYCWTSPQNGVDEVNVVDLTGVAVRKLLESSDTKNSVVPYFSRTGNG